MRIFLATDHAGFALKERVKRFLIQQGSPSFGTYDVIDYGPYVYDPSDDYPDTIQLAMEGLQTDIMLGLDSRGIIFGGSGQGEAMCANRYHDIRATVYYGDGLRTEDGKVYDIIGLSREHNNANVLSIGARFVDADKIFLVINQWLNMPFTKDERHIRRIEKIDQMVQ